MKKRGIKAISVILTALMCLTVVASAEIYIENNIPSSWVLGTEQIEITPQDSTNGIAYLEVNGVSVAGNKGQISQNGTPYYKIKLASETDSELKVDVLLGNISAKTGQFAFRFNENLAFTAVAKSANTELLTENPSANKKGSFYVDATNRVGYVTWYNAGNTVDGTTEEKVLLTLTFEKVNTNYSFNFNTFKGEPLATELNNPALSKGAVIQKVSGTSVTDYCTANQNLDYVIECDGKVFVDNISVLSFAGQASDAVDGKFNVKVINGIGETKEETLTVNVDDTEPQVSFNASVSENTISVTDISVTNDPLSQITSFVAELIKDGDVISTPDINGNSVTFENLETGIYTIKVTATTGAGKSSSTTKRVAVGDAKLFTPGDILEDGAIDVRDAVKLLKYIANIETLTESELLAADTLYDGVIDVRDAVKLLKYIANIETSLGE